MAELTREVARRTPAPAPSARRSGATPAVASPQSVVPVGVGNAAIARLVTRPGPGAPHAVRTPRGPGITLPAQPKLRVTDPAEPAEREAEAVAKHVIRVGTPTNISAAPGAMARQEAAAPAGGDAPSIVEQVVSAPGPGETLDDEVRSRVEPVLGADLGPVRVHRDARAQAAATAIEARAFTVGADIFLGPGESAADLALMAHEATHVVQQQAVQVFRVGHPVRGPPRPTAMRAIPGADGTVGHVASDIAQEIPGYVLLCQVVGEDLITGDPVQTGPEGLLESLLSHGPFAGAFGAVLKTLDVLGDIVDLVRSRLAEHNLTFSRFMSDISAAWDEISLIEGIDYNVAIVERYVDRIVADVRAFVSAIVDDVLSAVRAAAAAALQPLLDRPEVKPYWDLAIKVFHYDPLRGVEVQAPTVEILADFLHLAGRDAVLAQMQERGTLQQTADWLDTQFAGFAAILVNTRQLFADAWDAIRPSNLVELPSRLPELVDRAVGLVREVAGFVSEILLTILKLIKDALLGWLSEHAHGMRGFRLLTVILGRNPFTGAPVDRSAENLVGGFIALLPNGEATYQQLAESGVIARTAGRIDSEMTRLGISWELITGTFQAVWVSLTLEDLLAPVAAFERVLNMFGEPLGRIVEFVIVVVQAVIELILALMGFPSDLLAHIIDQVSQAITDIMNDPVAFLLHLIDALKQGLSRFFDNVLTHLLNGLTDWLFRGLRALGIEPPTSISPEAIITLVIQVLGVTAEALWAKLAEKIGPEKVQMMRGAIDKLGQAWAFITDITERGVTVVWEFIQGQLSNLWDMILNAATDWIMREIIEKVTAKLLSMLDPTGIMAVVNSAIAFFKAVQSAIEYLTDILRIVDGWVSTVADIARGAVEPGAQKLEGGFAAAIPVAIGFLANQVGLSDVPEKVREIINSLRELFWEAVSWVIDQAIRLGQAALGALGLGGEDPAAEGGVINEPVPLEDQTHHLRDDGAGGALVLHSANQLVSTIDDNELQKLVTEYNNAKSAAARRRTARTVAEWIAAKVPAGGPGGSAPGLGAIQPHGKKPDSINERVPLWSLRSEHVVPFAVVREVWTVLGVEGDAPRGVLSREDESLTTIMIYLDAGKAKDVQEAGLRTQTVEELVALASDYEKRANADTPEGDLVAKGEVMSILNKAKNKFVQLTVDMIAAEHALVDGGATTRGERRAESSPLPPIGDVRTAATQELADAEDILDRALARSVRPKRTAPRAA